MKIFSRILLPLLIGGLSSSAQIPANLVVDGVPEISSELKAAVNPYLEYRAAGFSGWHPTRREILAMRSGYRAETSLLSARSFFKSESSKWNSARLCLSA